MLFVNIIINFILIYINFFVDMI